MNRISHEHIVGSVLLFILSCFFTEIPAAAVAGDYDYSNRKRECEIKIVSADGVPMQNMLFGIGLLSNHFTFGGSIRGEALDTLIEGYEEKFMEYFDAAVPVNEMKWENVMNCAEKCAPDFLKADSIVNWLFERKIPVFGRCLFSNEKDDRIPEWTRSLGTAAFKQAMQERIDTAMSHFKGKVARWDLIDAICHSEDGSVPAGSMLETKSGDTVIFKWIANEARKIDTIADFVISDNGIFTPADSTAADKFINKVKPLSGKFDIVGVTAHFGANMDKSSYEAKINYLATQLGKTVLLTDIDFSFDISQAPDKIEELMRTCFANPNVEGIIMGSWCKRYMSDSTITSYFIDSLYNQTPCGQRWDSIRTEWKTEITTRTDDSGKFIFTGFQGRYQVITSCECDTFYLEPGEGTKHIEIIFNEGTAVNNASAGLKTSKISINGIAASIKLPACCNKQLFLATYSLSGQQLSRSPVNLTGGKLRVASTSSCSRVFRIETADRMPLYTGKIIAVR